MLTTFQTERAGEAKLRCPRGYRFRIVKKRAFSTGYKTTTSELLVWVITIKLLKNNEEIGYVDLLEHSPGVWETHSSLDETERGKGLGSLMYAKAIHVVLKRGQHVRSSATPSADAQRTWRSRFLNELYRIRFNDGMFFVHGRKKSNRTFQWRS